MLTWTFSPLEETKYLFRVGVWVWEAGRPPKTKSPTTTHYMIRLVGMGITSTLSVSGRILAGWDGVLGAKAEARAPQETRLPEGRDGSPLVPGLHPWTCPSLGILYKAKGEKARAAGPREPPAPAG